jgi:hypothetical protein
VPRMLRGALAMRCWSGADGLTVAMSVGPAQRSSAVRRPRPGHDEAAYRAGSLPNGNNRSRDFGKFRAPGTIAPALGNEGVGEHVRTRFHLGDGLPVKLRILGSAPNEENLFLLPDRFSKERTPRKTIQPFDLMSRRHPLSSTRALYLRPASKSRSS